MKHTAQGFVDFLLSRVGEFYVYGTIGRPLTKAILDWVRKTYPQQLSAERYNEALEKRLGKRTRDCIGLAKEYWWMQPDGSIKYNATQDVSANQMRDLCKASKDMSAIPELPGLFLFMSGHVGYYVGDGQAVEAKGFSYGVVKSPVRGRGWTSWGKCPLIDYGSANPPKPAADVTVPGALAPGDRVRVSAMAMQYYPGGPELPKRLRGKTVTVKQALYRGKTVVKGGKRCVLLGDEIETWCSTENLTKV